MLASPFKADYDLVITGGTVGAGWRHDHGDPFSTQFKMEVTALARRPAAQLSPTNACVTYGHVHLNVSNIEVHKKLWVDTFGGVFVQKGPLMTVKFTNMLIALANKVPTGPSQGTAHGPLRLQGAQRARHADRAARRGLRRAKRVHGH